ncbi:unnamed protein product [Caenorhabditis brenneri]
MTTLDDSNLLSNFMLVTGAKKISFIVDVSFIQACIVNDYCHFQKENKHSSSPHITFVVDGCFRFCPQIYLAPADNMFATPVSFSVSTKL